VRKIFAALALVAAACGQGSAVVNSQAEQLQLTGRVVDEANLIDPATEEALTNSLAALEARTSDQLVVVTVSSLKGQPIEKASLDLANRWGIGRADEDNGVVMLVAPTDRKVRIEVGLGLEGLLTDAKSADVIQLMLPEFRAGRMQEGIVKGVNAVEAILQSDMRRPHPKALKEAA